MAGAHPRCAKSPDLRVHPVDVDARLAQEQFCLGEIPGGDARIQRLAHVGRESATEHLVIIILLCSWGVRVAVGERVF